MLGSCSPTFSFDVRGLASCRERFIPDVRVMVPLEFTRGARTVLAGVSLRFTRSSHAVEQGGGAGSGRESMETLAVSEQSP